MKKTLCLLFLLCLLLTGCQRAIASSFEPADLARALLEELDDADELTMADRDYMETNLPTLKDKGVVYFGSDDDVCEFGIFRLQSSAEANDAEVRIRAYVKTEREAIASLSSLYPSDDLSERLWCYDHAKIGRMGETVYYFIMDAESLDKAERIFNGRR